MQKQILPTIGYVCGMGAQDHGCKLGPAAVRKSAFLSDLPLSLQWVDMIESQDIKEKLQAIPLITNLCEKLSDEVYQLVQQHQRFLVIGGDHTCGIGTWSGAAKALKAKGKMGLLWIDAHLDSHTPVTSHSKNVHGMPVAALLGYFGATLGKLVTHEAIILPQNICFIGVRSFEPEEKTLLDHLGVKIFYMDDIHKHGFDAVFNEGLRIIKKDTVAYGVSLDLDGIDPMEAPGVGSPVKNGIKTADLLPAFEIINADPDFIGAEIAEFNPQLDVNQKTEQLIPQLISALFLESKSNAKK